MIGFSFRNPDSLVSRIVMRCFSNPVFVKLLQETCKRFPGVENMLRAKINKLMK